MHTPFWNTFRLRRSPSCSVSLLHTVGKQLCRFTACAIWNQLKPNLTRCLVLIANKRLIRNTLAHEKQGCAMCQKRVTWDVCKTCLRWSRRGYRIESEVVSSPKLEPRHKQNDSGLQKSTYEIFSISILERDLKRCLMLTSIQDSGYLTWRDASKAVSAVLPFSWFSCTHLCL